MNEIIKTKNRETAKHPCRGFFRREHTWIYDDNKALLVRTCEKCGEKETYATVNGVKGWFRTK